MKQRIRRNISSEDRVRRTTWVLTLALAAVLAAGMAPAGAAGRPVVCVADFYAIPAMPIAVFTDVERFAADELSPLLLRAGGDAVTVLPRTEVSGAERSLGWRGQDALKFDRLGALTHAMRCDRVVTGWIDRVAVFQQGLFLFSGQAALNTQVYDARQGRIVWEQSSDGFALGGTPDFAVVRAIHDALARVVPAALPVVAAPVDDAPQP
jgi:hypothetical protein